jgi:hypothetical protein
MIYESRAPRLALLKGPDRPGVLRFRPSDEGAPGSDHPYGIFDTNSTDPELARCTPAEASAFIEASEPFQKGEIWKKDARRDRERGAKEGAARSAVVNDMTEAQLRGVITGTGVACPGEGAEIEVLRQLADDCLQGRVQAGAVPAVPVETAEAKPAGGKKAKK